MKKTNITGWQDVFSFTLIQTFKSKAFIISFIILLTLAFVSMPLFSLITSGNEETVSPIKKVYVNNQTALPQMEFTKLQEDEALSHITFETMQEDYDSVADRVEAKENASVILTLSEDEGKYTLGLVKASEGPVKDSSLSYLGDAISKQFDIFRTEALGISQEQINMLQAPVEAVISLVDVSGNPIIEKDTSISQTEYWFIYGILFVVLMVNMMASTQIATSIVTEKSTRVIEYLLTSVKPLALMVGKILAMLLAVIIQMATLVIAMFISNILTASIFSSDGNDILSNYLPKNIFENINILNIFLCFVLVGLGLIFYAILAGFAGATVSKIEELNEGLTLFTLSSVVGAYVGLGAANVLMASGENAFVTFAFLFPLSSPFVLPGAIMIGKASLPIVAIALVLQIIFILLLVRFVAKVFETLIIHNGTRIKLNDLFKISKTA